MGLEAYFIEDDGSLPEVEIAFKNPDDLAKAFHHLFDCGGSNVTVNGGRLWLTEADREKPFTGPEDVTLVTSGKADAFHIVLGGIIGIECEIPDLGVFVGTDDFSLDYRMGEEWNRPQIASFIALLSRLCDFDGVLSVPWWGASGERDFLAAVENYKLGHG